jgi:hypothetical protein
MPCSYEHLSRLLDMADAEADGRLNGYVDALQAYQTLYEKARRPGGGRLLL